MHFSPIYNGCWLVFGLSCGGDRRCEWAQVELRRCAFLFNDRGFFIAQEELYLIVVFTDQNHVIEAYNFLLALIPPTTLLISNTFDTGTILHTVCRLDNTAHRYELCDI